jgi:hypothetical protein
MELIFVVAAREGSKLKPSEWWFLRKFRIFWVLPIKIATTGGGHIHSLKESTAEIGRIYFQVRTVRDADRGASQHLLIKPLD